MRRAACHADKRIAVGKLLADEEWAAKSDRWIAERCAVSHNFVSVLRKGLSSDDSSRERQGRDGKTRKPPAPTKRSGAPSAAVGPPRAVAERSVGAERCDLASLAHRDTVATVSDVANV